MPMEKPQETASFVTGVFLATKHKPYGPVLLDPFMQALNKLPMLNPIDGRLADLDEAFYAARVELAIIQCPGVTEAANSRYL